MKKEELINLFNQFNKKRVLIVGDSMIDAYMWGHIERMSPEAPVPVVQIDKHENRLGGAANVARNIRSLGADTVLCTVVGDDEKSLIFDELLKNEGITNKGVFISKKRRTTLKTRIISDDKHQIRVDEEDVFNIKEEKGFINLVNKLMIDCIDVIILQDYNKGVLTRNIIKTIVKKAKEKNIPVIVDPKEENYDAFTGCDTMKPNLNELKKGMNLQFNDDLNEIQSAAIKLKNKLNLKSVLLTLSEKGICIQYKDSFKHYPAFENNIVDVSGAGDTVISVAALCLACKVNYSNLAILSNLAGGIVCRNVGVVPINKNLFLEKSLELKINN